MTKSHEEMYSIIVAAERERARVIAEMLQEAIIFVGKMVSPITRAIKNKLIVAEAKHNLYNMSNRQLADIGISRGDIEFVVDPKKKVNSKNKKKASWVAEDFADNFYGRLANLYSLR